MGSMKLIGYYAVYNEADFIKESLESVYDYLDEIIIIEGAWKETYTTNGHMRSYDGTIDKIKSFNDPEQKIHYYEENADDQLAQRNLLWPILWGRRSCDQDVCLLLIDGDEVYEKDEIEKIRALANSDPKEAEYTIDSLTFINDLYTYTPIRFPRFWKLKYDSDYRFIQPNTIAKNGKVFEDTINLPVVYFHYSYCHSADRFMEKKKERTKKHGDFSWELREGLVQKDGVDFKEFTGSHPETMLNHKLIGTKRHRIVKRPETIVYVEHSGIGNLVLATPLLTALRQAKPDAHIHVISWNRSARILEGWTTIDSIVSADEQGALCPFEKMSIDHLLISPVGSLEQVVSWLGQRAKNTIRMDISAPWVKHEAEYKLSLAKRLGWNGTSPKCFVHIHPYNRQNAYDRLFESKVYNRFLAPENVIGINAAYLKNEHWSLKHWGNKNFAALIQNIYQEYPDYKFIFLGSEADKDDAEEIIKMASLPENYTENLCGFSKDIKDTAAILAYGSIELLIGNDGGLQHIAAGVGLKTLTIFTFTNPVKNKPFNDGEIIMTPCENRLTCQHGNWDKCKDNGCLDTPIGDVMKKVRSILPGEVV